ncbi:beta-1:3-galactosyltransferase 2-like protein [Dinothrombium tinctorium]|uniref:Hexosyltransferase n=1 Tax=Dinothrombium tinctorium TaxID=1965070 RepID=A0A3S3PKJ7_9ACAR|nr:beta-1:3-galactosyltransferase 2-like protein [Dinothrombium tinctorium]
MLLGTNKFVINKVNFCGEDLGAAIDLIVIVTSSVTNFEQRAAIRETWGQFAVERGALLLFLVGSHLNQSIQNAIREEEKKHGDMLQAAFIDNYFNLTLKSISMMRWIAANCNKVKFVFKVDDDMFVNMQLLVDFSETRTFSKSIIGKIARRWTPQRRNSSKWYLPKSLYNANVFPDFATGPSYMFTGDAAAPLLEESLKSVPLYLEDVYITGIVAAKAKIRRLNYSLFKNAKVKVSACNFGRFITSHQHSPKEIRRLWKLVYANVSKEECAKPVKPKNNPKSKSH